MKTLILRQIKDRRTAILVYAIFAVLLMWMYVALFPTIRNQAAELLKLTEGYPEPFIEAFGVSEASFGELENWVSTEQFSFVWPIMVIFLMASLAGSGIAGEIEKGTAALLLARPVSRLVIFFSRFFTGCIVLLAFNAVAIFSVIPFAELHGINYRLGHFATLYLMATLFGLAVLALALFFSAVFSEKGKVYFAVGGILIVMYVFRIIAAFSDVWDWLKYASFFHYFDPNRALVENEVSGVAAAVFLAVAAAAVAAGAWRFVKRDIAV